MARACTEEQFLKDVANHMMTIRSDDGLIRVVNFRQEKTISLHFSLITWPGFLCITGDMGTYVFSRELDLFQFFRSEPVAGDSGLHINLSYWAEKLQATDKNSKVKEYDYEIFKQVIQERVDEAETTKIQRDAIAGMVADLKDKDIRMVQETVQDFEVFEFTDFWEHDLTDYSYHFVWCCYAIAWGIMQYDKWKEGIPHV